MKVVAPAKINLWLRVGERRPDGYHEIISVMQAVSLADDLDVTPADATTLEVSPAGSVPEDESNLVTRAARAMLAATGTSRGAAIRLTKRIPVAAGLAGGSADAAATLVGLNELWGAGISRKALERTGATIGADVPFCVRGGTAVARGIGADLAPLACAGTLWWVLASSAPLLSTAAVYAERDRQGAGPLEDPHELADALARGDVGGIAAALRNDLTEAAEALEPASAEAGRSLREAGAIGVVMSGSGPTWCGLARDEDHARGIEGRAREGLRWCQVVRSLPHGARVEPRAGAADGAWRQL